MPNSGSEFLIPLVPNAGVPGAYNSLGYSTLLPLDTWRSILGYSPWAFWGWSTGSATGVLPTPTGCSQPMRAHSWQDSDNGSRDDVAFAIENAENTLRQYLGYSVAPHYAEEILKYPSGTVLNSNRYSWGLYNSAWPSVQLSEGYVQTLGPRALTSAALGTPVSYTDLDGDTIKETFTLTFATAETDANVLHVYIAAADRWDGSGAGDQWEVRPVRKSISAGIATIRGGAWLLAVPVKYEGAGKVALDPTVAGNFVTTLDVYTSAANQAGITQADAEAVLLYETHPWPSFGFCCWGGTNPSGISTDPSSVGYVIARGGVKSERGGAQGWVYTGASVWQATTSTWSAAFTWAGCNYPDRVLVRYLAGYPLESNIYSPYYGQMARQYQEIVARLAAAQLVRPPLPCESAGNRELARWQLDASQVRGRADELYATTKEILNCPFGTKRGEWWAYKQVLNLQVAIGITI